ncbi:MAG: PKD domain-containing protein [Planctomycetaceae bacterium]|nr:PKD domain-containing protein [Planctomycetaceae bacterium]
MFRLILGAAILVLASSASARAADPIEPLLRTIDLNVGESQTVELCDGSSATVKLLALNESRDDIRGAVRRADVVVEVNGERKTLTAAYYRLPVEAGGVQIDCAVTRGCATPEKNPWALDADARFRLWPKNSPFIRPETFTYPVKQLWFATDTQMANDPCYVNGGEAPGKTDIYYHWGLDVGGVEGKVEIVCATDGLVVSARGETLESEKTGTPVKPRYDVVYVKDGRGWYYRYSHMQSIDDNVKLGERIAMGSPMGILGKEGASGGWSHLHFDISAMQPSGRYGIVEAYAFYAQSYLQQHPLPLKTIARPHHVAWTDQTVTLDGSRSAGVNPLVQYHWTFTDGATAEGQSVQRRYDRPGTYSEILRVRDSEGHVDYDLAVVQVFNRDDPQSLPPSIHAAYWPTRDLKVGQEITFAVRSFQIGKTEGHEEWDFGDGSPAVRVQSDGNAVTLAKDGYALTTHRYAKPGHYLVRVQRTNDRGESAVGHVHVKIEGTP